MDQAFEASVGSGICVNLRPIFRYWCPVGVSLSGRATFTAAHAILFIYFFALFLENEHLPGCHLGSLILAFYLG
jgi:hypothetical protein